MNQNISYPVLYFYSLKSNSLDFFNAPFISSSDVEAILTLRNGIATGQIPPHVVKDCSLYLVGIFDTRLGQFAEEGCETFICNLIEVAAPQEVDCE